MLVLSRKRDEVIEIGEDIRITVLEIKGSYAVRIGIEAPADVPVHRLEVADAIRRRERGES